MITASNLSANTVQLKRCALLMDSNPERRALRKKIMALHGVEMIGAGDLDEAASIWHRDRYDMVLIDIRKDYGGALALRDDLLWTVFLDLIAKGRRSTIVLANVNQNHVITVAMPN